MSHLSHLLSLFLFLHCVFPRTSITAAGATEATEASRGYRMRCGFFTDRSKTRQPPQPCAAEPPSPPPFPPTECTERIPERSTAARTATTRAAGRTPEAEEEEEQGGDHREQDDCGCG